MPHYLLHKPAGYLSQFINNGPKQSKKKLLGELYPFPEGTMAIGRLDENSEGLLLLTTNGKLSEHIRSSKIEKEYWAQVDGIIPPEALEQLSKGVEIGFYGKRYLTKACEVRNMPAPQLPPRVPKIRDERHGPTSWIAITLTEGKFRQIRKMTAAVGYPTLRLIRIRVGEHQLKELKLGEVKELHLPHFD